MNILMLTSVYTEPDDGEMVVTPTVKYICEEWVKAGHSVVVIHNSCRFCAALYYVPMAVQKKAASILGHNFPTKSSRKKIERIENGVKIFRLPMYKAIPHGTFNYKVVYEQFDKIYDIINQNNFRPDIAIGHWANPQILLLSLLKKKLGVRTALVFHNDCTDKMIAMLDIKKNIKMIDAIGCRNAAYSEYVKNKLELLSLPFVCYSGIPNAQIREIKKNENQHSNSINEKEFIYVGRLVKYKNVNTIIEALYIAFPDKKFKLHIVGEGAEKENLQKKIDTLNLKSNVMFHGQLKRKKVFDLMQKSMCFIMISDNETFGMVYLEAMLNGCITIASRNGGIDGIIKDNVNGFLCEQGNANELARILKNIDSLDLEKVLSIRKKGIETSIKFSDSNVAEKYLNDVLEWGNNGN